MDSASVDDYNPVSPRTTMSQSSEPRENLDKTRSNSSGPIKSTKEDDAVGHLENAQSSENEQEYHLYKRRFVGLVYMTMLNFVTNMERTAFSPLAETIALDFKKPLNTVETYSAVTGFAFALPAPLVIWILNRYGPKWSLVTASLIYVIGSWIHYAAVRNGSYSTFVAGTFIVAFAGPFSLDAPTRYSRLWFSDRGRTSATGLTTLASSAGVAIGSIMAPRVIEQTGLQRLTLIFAIIATVVCLPSLLIPDKPPTPPSYVASVKGLGVKESLKVLLRCPPFYLQLYSFAIALGAFEAITGLIVEIILPYGGTENQAGLANGMLVIFGLLAAFIAAPVMDRTRSHLIVIKIVVPLLAIAYTGLIFVPQARSPALLYVMFAIIGALAFSITPTTLELQVNWTYPASPEVSSTACWTAGFLMSSALTLATTHLHNTHMLEGQPVRSLIRGMILIAAMVWTLVPCALLTGVGPFVRPNISKAAGI